MTKRSEQHSVPSTNLTSRIRREVMAAMAVAGAAAAFGNPGYAMAQALRGAKLSASELAAHARDWDWLVGSWDVWHRRLQERLAGSNDWDEFAGKSVLWLTMGGLGNIDDNSLDFPGGAYRGLTIRAFDPDTRQWLSWWLDGRSPSSIAAPARGSFTNGIGTFIGDDVFNGRPIKTRSQWSQITAASARWEQASSADGGATWETNWTSDFARRT